MKNINAITGTITAISRPVRSRMVSFTALVIGPNHTRSYAQSM